MPKTLAPPGPLCLKDCSLISLSAGARAQNLRELRDQIGQAPVAALQHHFWGRLLRPSFDDPEYSNDFAAWAAHGLQDQRLAEQLGVLDPSDYDDWEGLRAELVEVIDTRLDESEHIPWARQENMFHFTRSQLVVFDTDHRVATPVELARLLPTLSTGTVYFHVVAARARPPRGMDDFRRWLEDFGDVTSSVVQDLANVDPFFRSLSDLREAMADVMGRHYPEART